MDIKLTSKAFVLFYRDFRELEICFSLVYFPLLKLASEWKVLSPTRSSHNAIYHLRAVKMIELKPFKATTIEVAYAKRAMSKR